MPKKIKPPCILCGKSLNRGAAKFARTGASMIRCQSAQIAESTSTIGTKELDAV